MKIKFISEPGDGLFVPRPLAIGFAAIILIAAIACTIISNMPTDRETATATYKGYMSGVEKYHYPIIELDGVEYTSVHGQRVRDSSYIGQPVTISYDKDNIKDFFIQWEGDTND